MGADIHSLVQRRILTPRWTDRELRRRQRDGVLEQELYIITWEEVKLLEWKNGAPFATDNWQANYINHDPDITPWYEDRNYGLFGILGGVRYRGGIELKPFRGYPPDYHDLEDVGDHSQTWYMCQELVDANIPACMPPEYGVTSDVEAFVQMNKDLVRKYGKDNVRIILGWDS